MQLEAYFLNLTCYFRKYVSPIDHVSSMSNLDMLKIPYDILNNTKKLMFSHKCLPNRYLQKVFYINIEYEQLFFSEVYCIHLENLPWLIGLDLDIYIPLKMLYYVKIMPWIEKTILPLKKTIFTEVKIIWYFQDRKPIAQYSCINKNKWSYQILV